MGSLSAVLESQRVALSNNDLTTWAKSLTTRAFSSYHSYYGLSTTSCQVYDTAWVAMIRKTRNNVEEWLFPECFYYILRAQFADGSWGILPTTQTAGILDTAASLLALLLHAKEPLQIVDVSPNEIHQRIERGFSSLRDQLGQWHDVEKSNHIGVELIVPALFAYLEKERGSFVFDYPCKNALESMNKAKLAQFKIENLYTRRPSSVLHSLEAFIDVVDFDRVSHHLYRGSMMASPSSTAAYLVGSSTWSDEAESYLRHIVKAGVGHGDGGIPGTYPTTHFECSWTLATLFQAGFTKEEIECDGLQDLVDILKSSLDDEGGIIGFAPHTADVDDTAKALLALELSGQHVSPDTMIRVFEGKDHFTTFGAERDPSLTSNLHVLLCLLHQPTLSRYSSQIVKSTRFICQSWWDGDFRIRDKWNLSHLYPSMLLVEAFTKLIHTIDCGQLHQDMDLGLQCKVSLSLFQACLRIMLGQGEDGSWGGYQEQTCYAILALSHARHISFFSKFRDQVQACMKGGSDWLTSNTYRSEDLTWTSKTAYNVAFVAEVYKVAALKAAFPNASPAGEIGHSLPFGSILENLEGHMRLVRKTSLFATLDEWQVRASMIESYFFVPLLQTHRLEIFPREEEHLTEDRYLTIIPFTWVGCNNRSRTFASGSWLYDMMMLSMFGYQCDEFIETVAGPAFPGTNHLHNVIDDIFCGVDQGFPGSLNEDNGETTSLNGNRDDASNLPGPQKVNLCLTKFVSWIKGHESVRRASSWDRDNLLRELKIFLHAHATQMEDNSRFAIQNNGDIFMSPGRSYFHWVRTTGGSHVACAWPLAFSNCLLSANLGRGEEVYPSVAQKYFCAAVSRHLTTTCRMYNDYGSMSRDSDERNINSMHFPEFLPCGDEESRKKSLAQLGEYETACLIQAISVLDKEIQGATKIPSRIDLDNRKLDILRLFCDVTDFYNQLYVVKDLSSSRKQMPGTACGRP